MTYRLAAKPTDELKARVETLLNEITWACEQTEIDIVPGEEPFGPYLVDRRTGQTVGLQLMGIPFLGRTVYECGQTSIQDGEWDK